MIDKFCRADDYRLFIHRLTGRARSRYHPEFSSWLSQSAWNQRNFGRLPEIIVRAQSSEDIKETLCFAREHGKQVAVRGGGHSYCGSFIRTDSILLDVSALNDIIIDVPNKLLSVGPGVTARQLATALERHELAFPSGHCGSVALGGFLLGGGMGINSAAWGGMSTFNIEGADLITADGEYLSVNAHQYQELFWAVRGAGPCSFFVVTRFYLRCYSKPRISNIVYEAPRSTLKPLLKSLMDSAPDPRLQIIFSLKAGKSDLPYIINTIAFTLSKEENESLQNEFIKRIPGGSLKILEEMPDGCFEDIYKQTDNMMSGLRFCSDNVVCNRIFEMLPIIDKALSICPATNTQTIFIWRGKQSFPDAAYSVQGDFFISTYLQWDQEENDYINRKWLNEYYNLLSPLSSGSYINEFDLENRSGNINRCYSIDNWGKLMALREKYDPTRVFVDVTTLNIDVPFITER